MTPTPTPDLLQQTVNLEILTLIVLLGGLALIIAMLWTK